MCESCVIPFPRNSAMPGAAARKRFVMTVSGDGSAAVSITVQDLNRNSIMFEWCGALARRMLDTGLPGVRLCGNGAYALDKATLQHLALAATAIEMRSDLACDDWPVDPSYLAARRALSSRVRELGIDLPRSHARIALQLFRYSGRHFSSTDAVCVTLLRYPMVSAERVESILDELVGWRVLQRIKVGDIRFYDVNTEPHLHIYCSQTHELVDAPTTGVLRVN